MPDPSPPDMSIGEGFLGANGGVFAKAAGMTQRLRHEGREPSRDGSPARTFAADRTSDHQPVVHLEARITMQFREGSLEIAEGHGIRRPLAPPPIALGRTLG